MNRKLWILLFCALAASALMDAGNHMACKSWLALGDLVSGGLAMAMVVVNAVEYGKDKTK